MITLHGCFMSLKNLHVNLRTTFIGDGNVIFFPLYSGQVIEEQQKYM